MLRSNCFYDRLARVFDVMTDWPKRLAYEMPFIQKVLDEHEARSILDIACGTGWHAITLAQKGYRVVGSDASSEMIRQAKANAARMGLKISFVVANFMELDKFSEEFDALLCLGNSLPHLLSKKALGQTFRQMRLRLKPFGVLILHNLNYDLRVKKKPRFFSANGNEDSLIWRFADYGKKFITFHTALFVKSRDAKDAQKISWMVEVNSTKQRPLLRRELQTLLEKSGFRNMKFFGGLDGSPFIRDKSGDLVIVASL
ncbi:MAG: class I SAM-dependent methyltransferase [Thermodesulfobacteriota bacterium]